jgi:nicotinamidase-related amidase
MDLKFLILNPKKKDKMEQRSALLVMDFQTGIVSNYPAASAILDTVSATIAHARSNGIPVIYVVVGFRQGMPEISRNNLVFAGSKQRSGGKSNEEMMKVVPQLAPQEGDIMVVKRRFSAFTGSDLEVLLRSLDVNHLVISGVITSGVVLSTVREAADKDFKLTVLSDCCADGDQEVHDILLNKVFPRQATVQKAEEWMA